MLESSETISQITEIGIQALRAAKVVHDELGENGLVTVPSPNQFNERVLKVDLESERTVLEILRESNLPLKVFSEEYGKVDLRKDPEFLGTLDGMDGSSQFEAGRGILRYATMLGIAFGTDPNYEDYVFSGIMEHPTNKLWIGVRGQGSFLVDPDGNRTQICTSSKTVFDGSAKVYSMQPEYNATSSKYLTGFVRKFQAQIPWSAAIEYVDIASGKFDLGVEATRKDNLEQMIAFGLIKEAGGVMVDIDNRSIGDQRYLEWGQRESLLLVTAATHELARDFLEKLGRIQNA